ncbi:MAG: hypothetical protein KQH57_17270 [Actinomycetales bacterium]|nr:hypothetical protein [Actinomycetales bacterium]
MTARPEGSLSEALEGSIAAATHLTTRDAAAVAAARALAAKIDAWDVIVRWAQDDAAQTGARPRIPAHDNISLGSFLKYLEALQIVPPAEHRKPGPASTASDSQRQINEMRQQIARGALTLVPDASQEQRPR